MIKAPENRTNAVVGMALDSRLANLKDAIKEDWKALEVAENEGELVIRVKKAYEMYGVDEAVKALSSSKPGRQEHLPAT